MLGPVRLGLTVALAQRAGSLHGATAALLLVVPPPAPLVSRLLQGQGGVLASLSDLTLDCGVLLAAVILRVIIKSELKTVVAATDQIAHTTVVTIVRAAVLGSVTVSLPLLTGLLWSATSPFTVVPPGTPLTSWWIQGLCWV